jgi:RimJ/RimL family protein N-acetyltransferase
VTVTLRQPLTLDECQQVREWRNAPDVAPMLRTGYKTEEEQAAFYRDVICNQQQTNHRYYALEHGADFVGIGGLTYLDKRPGVGEISLVLGPDFRRRGIGAACVRALLAEAYGPLRLRSVVGESYAKNPALLFWIKMLTRMVDEGNADAVEHLTDERTKTLYWNWKRER